MVLAMEQSVHVPVMMQEVLDYLDLKPGKTVLDATVGMGGHAEKILERIVPGGTLIALDRDQESLELARERLSGFSPHVKFVHGNFSEMDALLTDSHITYVDAILFDLGVSSFQLQDSARGFSFQEEGPLDMRLDRTSYISAYDLVNNLNEEEISHLLWIFGEERWHNRIARHLVRERQRHPISSTLELSKIVMEAIPGRYRNPRYRIHPATRTFQAVRIAVNRELESLTTALNKSVDLLSPGGRLCAISFHSLEDRIVKHTLRQFAQAGKLKVLTPKPLTPALAEIGQNPRSRSAKFRSAERTAI